jgi:hypothetical protein
MTTAVSSGNASPRKPAEPAPASGVIPVDWENREKIRELICSLNWLSDDNRLDDLLAQFTDDLRYEVEGMVVFHDKPALRQFLEEVVGAFGMRIHRISNEIIEVRGRTASSRCYWRADLERRGRALVSAGRYFDEFVCVAGVWKVSSRKATMTYISPLEEGWARTRYFSLA